MNKHIQIREIPEEMHRAIKERAAAEGMSMSDYLRRLIEQDLKRPDWTSIRARLTSMEPVELPVSTTRIIREERDGR
ncbi:MAG: ribbon-helix-helix protein, CopG family [Oceanicaulis sp.]|uniref:FitA-like ribbon-helix-helix domain-containing protein n=1 Tax=Glycocaulis sp. TaxID=1969725 RepID=UPI0025BDA977|nr:ribbon-helix-helix protein, CopG family [Glycocaulis sp.]MCC5980668.1 ribbon-helix-helix protein, CopG family [Oceanicaulis sp.]MCH8521895.1 ribbon-helix-helix protein, CopG family [Glycocaulis sp.]